MTSKNALYIALAFIMLFLIITAVVLINYARVAKPVFDLTPIAPITWSDTNKSVDGWMANVAKLNKSSDVLPVNLMYIELNERKSSLDYHTNNKTLRYQVLISKCTDYSIFCMQRVAKSLDIELSLVRQNGSHTIFINTNSAVTANSFITNLKKYNINSTLKEVK